MNRRLLSKWSDLWSKSEGVFKLTKALSFKRGLHSSHNFCQQNDWLAGARYTKSIAILELRHKEHNNDPYSLHNNTIDFTP